MDSDVGFLFIHFGKDSITGVGSQMQIHRQTETSHPSREIYVKKL